MGAAAESTGTLDAAMRHAFALLSESPTLALEQVDAILSALPDYPPAQRLRVDALLATQRFDEAADQAEALVQAQPNWAQAHFARYLAGRVRNEGEVALGAIRRAAELKPDLPGVWLALADQLAAIGDDSGAERAYARHVRHSVRDPELLAAATALQTGALPQAEAGLRARLRQQPTDTAALRMLGEVAARLGRTDDAEVLLRRCLELAPDFHEARYNLAFVLHRANQPEAALVELERLLSADPRNPAWRNLKAVVLCRIGDYPPALEIYADILRSYPQQAKLWLSFGHALKTAGRTAEAIDAYRRCVALAPEFGEAWWSLANLKTFRFTDADVAVMRAGLARADLDGEHRLHLDFALGKALEDRSEYAGSMRHYLAGNALRKQRVPYRADDTHARVERSIETFTRDFFEARRGFGSAAPDPVFVVGLPRSGSTLVEQILSSHPQVEGTQELPEIISIVRSLRERGGRDEAMPYYAALAQLDAQSARVLGERYLANTRIQRHTQRPLFIDKMPNNFAHIALIQLILPNAKIIDVRRHPLACCFSGFKQHFARGQNFSYDLADIGRYYRDYVALMAHYDDALPGRVHRVIYEDLVADTEYEVRRLLDHLRLEFDPACLRFFENERPVRTASSEQVRRPINRDGLDQWRHFDPWLQPLRDALGGLQQEHAFRAATNVVAAAARSSANATT